MTASSDVAKVLAKTVKLQGEAADPAASVWVSANAGTGKTHVLTNRTLRLMLAGTPPEKILCLTYTKAAAAEMSTRVFNRLAGWVTVSGEALNEELASLFGRSASDDELALARTLFTKAIETPGGLKVQTIHAFCERLLQRFPLEAGVPPGFQILDDDLGAKLKREAIDHVLRAATRQAGSSLNAALGKAIAHAADDRFDEVLSDALAKREWLAVAVRMDDASPARNTPELDAYGAVLRHHFGVADGLTVDEINDAQADVVSDAVLTTGAEVLSRGAKTDQDIASHLSSAAKASTKAARIAALSEAFLTKDGTARKTFITKAVRAKEAGLSDTLTEARDTFAGLEASAKALGVIEATLALITLASAVMERYSQAKAQRAALDFEDLIVRTGILLTGTASAEWVLYKLDGGLDHILVDESQDTSPEQWAVIEALAREFFSGEGSHDIQRTLFAVGDEKQSIYSFQGAAPDMFAAMGKKFAAMAGNIDAPWRAVPLNLSFRTVAPILEAVDTVLADPAKAPGIRSDASAPLKHEVKRIGSAGLVEIWPTERPVEAEPGDLWQPLAESSDAPPVARVAHRIADTIGHWLSSGEMLVSENRPIRASDILILVRKRAPFAGPMVSALKARGIAVAGADRLDLNQQIAVQDLVALGDFLTLPEDDLSLACVLKSPLVGLDDDDLFALSAYQDDDQVWRFRGGSLWRSLLASRGIDPKFANAVEQLVSWRKRADFQPPYEFFAQVLDKDGMRKKLLARLGSEAADPLEAFLDLTLNYDEGSPPSLSGFLAWLRTGKREIKRDMEQGADEVRVMTVHGSKGLEAPIVFLPDTCTTSTAGGSRQALAQIDPNGHGAGTYAWQVKGSSKIPAIAAAKSLLNEKDTEERNRLLYVAMTRARDRLYVCGFEGVRAPSAGCWYDLIADALTPFVHSASDYAGREVLRMSCEQAAEYEKDKSAPSASEQAGDLPDWAHRRAPSAAQITVPLAPSRLAPYETDDEGEPSPSGDVGGAVSEAIAEEPAAPGPAQSADERRFLRGTLTHQLLEHLPHLPPDIRSSAAKAFLATQGSVLPTRVHASIVEECLSILDHPEYAALFGSDSRAEVSIAAELPRPSGRGPAIKLSGQIDRLAEIGDDVMIIDYKTNRPPPSDPAAIADAYILQLAAYRLAIAEIYPGRTIRAAIMWTMGARLVEIPAAQLDEMQQRLWQMDAQPAN